MKCICYMFFKTELFYTDAQKRHALCYYVFVVLIVKHGAMRIHVDFYFNVTIIRPEFPHLCKSFFKKKKEI